MTRVLIAVDGSRESNDAAQFAHRLFGDSVEYLVVTVAETGAPVSYTHLTLPTICSV